MKKAELEKLFSEVNQKIGSAEDLQSKVVDATTILANAQIAENKTDDVESKDHDLDLLNKIIEYGDKVKNLFIR